MEARMTEENKVPPEGSESSTESSWQEVGRQFQTLGESLAQAVRSAWENEETQRRVNEMRTGLESMAREVGKAVEDTANSSQGQKIRADAERAAESVRVATEQTVQEARPQLINALQQLNSELQKLIDRIESKRDVPASEAAPDPDSSQEPQG
jgi:uncharacterized phage infection (PIP) family protein YhgE